MVESGPDGRVDLPALLRSLREEGVRALLCEGGPTLHGALQAAGLVDELFLTIAPKLAGGEAPRILEGAAAGGRRARARLAAGARTASSSPATAAAELAFPRPEPRGEDAAMDFKPSPQVETLRERILDFMDEQIYPQEREIMEALDAEVGARRPLPEDPGRDPRAGQVARASGTSSCPTSATARA